jgi:hypothetical protein
MRASRLQLILLLTLLVSSLSLAKTEYKYSYIPKKVFQTQVFPVTIFANTDENENPPHFLFDATSEIQPIETTPLKDTNGGNTFYTFYFKAKTSDIQIPTLTITDNTDTTVLERQYIPVQVLDTEKEKSFCGLIATSCEIITSQVSEFDAENNLVSLTLKASEANPNEMHTVGSIESGIEKITKQGSESIIEYYFVIPSSQKSITSSYYNTLQNRFITKTLSTNYKDNPVAAQENLNPIDSSFNKLKKYGLGLLSLFFLGMFWKKKEIFFLVLLAICIIILFTLFTPHGKICIQEGAPLYILPTKTSSTSGQIREEITTDILNQRGEYTKIAYEHNIIGWIKDEDICKD